MSHDKPSLLCLLVVSTLWGCTDSETTRLKAQRPSVVPVSGTVLFQGQPVEGASVTFMNSATSTSGSGLTDTEGRYKLTTFEEADGVAPGVQKVSIRKVEVIDRRKPGVDYSTTSEPLPPPEERWLIPKRYSSFDDSGLTVTVTPQGKNEFTFNLED